MRKILKLTLKIILFSIIVFIWLLPFWWMIITSMKTQEEILQYPPTLWPHNVSFDSYKEVFKKIPMLKFFSNSLLVAFATTTIAVFTSSLAGYIFAKFQFKWKNFIFLSILSTIMIPLIVIIIPLYFMVIKVGLKNTLWALIIPGTVSALGTFLMRNYLKALPNSYIEAARIDGASEFRIYLTIILPLSKPAIVTIYIFLFVLSWDSFLWPLVVIDDLSKRTLPLGVGLFTQLFGVQSWNIIMSATLISIIPMLIIFLIFQRFFIKGISLSGLKD